METFQTLIHRPFTSCAEAVTVTYELRDCGVMMKTNENVRPVILSVERVADGVNLLSELDWEVYTALVNEARMDAQDKRDARKQDFQEELAAGSQPHSHSFAIPT